MTLTQQPARCTTCQEPIGWISCPTGGWWAHEQHPVDGHDAQPYLRDEIAQALSEAGAFCGECGFQPDEIGCPDCVRVRHLYVEAVASVVQPRLARRTKIRNLEAEIERLRAELAAAREPIAVDDFARILCDADKSVFGSTYPGWDDLSDEPGRGKDQVRKSARYLLRRLNINRHRPPAQEG